MSYQSLYKLYFTLPDEGKDIYSQRYHSNQTIHIPIQIDHFPAFIYLDPEINDSIQHITSTNIQDDAYKKEIMASHLIEGILCHEDDFSQKRFNGFVKHYKNLQEGKAMKITNVYALRRLYDDLIVPDPHDLPDGKLFRKEAVTIYNGSNGIHQGSYPESQIIKDLSHALTILNDESLPILMRVSLFHYLLGYIHPFYDGNGRLSRFLTSNYLCDDHPSLALSLSQHIYAHKKAYYKAFTITNDPRNRGDLTYFVLSFLKLLS